MPHWTMPAAAAVLAALMLAGCEAGGAPPDRAPEGFFTLRTIDGAKPQGSATIRLSVDGTLSGEGPCNAWHGRNAAQLPAFRLQGFVSTTRACLIEGGEAEFQDGLRSATRIAADSDGLIIDGGTHRLTFAPAPAE